jgi:hypothetical protein
MDVGAEGIYQCSDCLPWMSDCLIEDAQMLDPTFLGRGHRQPSKGHFLGGIRV